MELIAYDAAKMKKQFLIITGLILFEVVHSSRRLPDTRAICLVPSRNCAFLVP
jgi:hypothetical protein